MSRVNIRNDTSSLWSAGSPVGWFDYYAGELLGVFRVLFEAYQVVNPTSKTQIIGYPPAKTTLTSY